MSESMYSEPVLPDLMAKEDWHNMVKAEYYLTASEETPLSVIFVDINALKGVNDEQGHPAGDVVIAKVRELVTYIGSSLRTDANNGSGRADYVANSNLYGGEGLISGEQDQSSHGGEAPASRWGGDEFVILAQTGEEGAQILGDRLRTAFTSFLAEPQNEQLRELGVGIAIGTATSKGDVDDTELLKRADEAMYNDKMRLLPELSIEQQDFLKDLAANLIKHNLRLRDVEKYFRKMNFDGKED